VKLRSFKKTDEKCRAFRPFCGTNSLEVGIPTSKSCVTHWRKHPSSDQPELRDALHRSIKKTDEKCRAFHPFCGSNCLEVDVTDQQKLRDILATSTRPQDALHAT
jgi:endogenous inhibitor of DNA gyrase (YacG/DUF329 family)